MTLTQTLGGKWTAWLNLAFTYLTSRRKNARNRGTLSECITKVTTTALKDVCLLFKLAVRWTSINHYHGFHALATKRFYPRFSSTRRKMSAFKPFLQYFATGSDTSCQDYQHYEFVECLSEEIQIIDLFTHCIKFNTTTYAYAFSIHARSSSEFLVVRFYSITWKMK